MPTPATPVSIVTGQTIDKSPSALKEKFLRPCSQMIFCTSGRLVFAPAFNSTMQYSFVFVSICCMNSSVIVDMVSTIGVRCEWAISNGQCSFNFEELSIGRFYVSLPCRNRPFNYARGLIGNSPSTTFRGSLTASCSSGLMWLLS